MEKPTKEYTALKTRIDEFINACTDVAKDFEAPDFVTLVSRLCEDVTKIINLIITERLSNVDHEDFKLTNV